MIAIDPSSSSRIWASSSAFGLIRSVDGGDTWSSGGLANERVLSIAVDSHEHAVYAGTSAGRVFVTQDEGRHWSPLGEDLGEVPVVQLAVAPEAGRIYAATSGGVFSFGLDRSDLRSATRYSISLRTFAGNYLSATDCGGEGVSANAIVAGPCQNFTLLDLNGDVLRDGDLVVLQSASGAFVVAEDGGAGSCESCDGLVNANRFIASSWETFRIRSQSGHTGDPIGSTVNLQSASGDYLAAEFGGSSGCSCESLVHANRHVAREWETFTLTKH